MQKRRNVEAECIFDLAIATLSRIALAIGAIASNDQPGFDQKRQMPAQRSPCNAVGTQGQLCVGGKDDQFGVLAKLVVGIEAQQCVEHGQATILQSELFSCFGCIAEDLPFIDGLFWFDCGYGNLLPDQGKRHRPPPERRRQTSILHFPHLQEAKEIRSPKTVPKTLDWDSRKCDSSVATLKRRLPRRQRLGAFFLLLGFLSNHKTLTAVRSCGYFSLA